MLVSRDPMPRLRPFVRRVWVSDGAAVDGGAAAARERVLPTGATHVALRLEPVPLRVFETPDDEVGTELGCAVVGGARDDAYLRDVSRPVAAVGALLLPGAASLLFGVPADRLAGRHTPLEDLWGADVARLRERLVEESQPLRRLQLFETYLAGRLPPVRGISPGIAHALARLARGAPVQHVVEEVGSGRRRFVGDFREAVGLSPKRWCRVQRFQRVLEHVAARPDEPFAEVALAAGYSDQPHLNREFRAFTGLSPRTYRVLSPRATHHVPFRRGR